MLWFINLSTQYINIIGCSEGEIRLVNGNSEMEGRVEICLNDEWGTVCDQMWDDTDAGVVCQQLDLQSNGIVKPIQHVYNFKYFLISLLY